MKHRVAGLVLGTVLALSACTGIIYLNDDGGVDHDAGVNADGDVKTTCPVPTVRIRTAMGTAAARTVLAQTATRTIPSAGRAPAATRSTVSIQTVTATATAPIVLAQTAARTTPSAGSPVILVAGKAPTGRVERADRSASFAPGR